MLLQDDERFAEELHRSVSPRGEALPGGGDDLAEDADDLARMREALCQYKAETLRFAQQQSAGMPAPRKGRAVRLWHSAPRWAVAGSAVLALSLTALFATHHGSQPAEISVAAVPTAKVLAEDNRLLLSVDQALSANSVPSEEELGLASDGARHKRVSN